MPNNGLISIVHTKIFVRTLVRCFLSMILKKFPFFLFYLTFWRFINHHFLFYRCIHTNTIDINEVSKIRWVRMINIGGVHQLKFYRRYFLKYSHTKKMINFSILSVHILYVFMIARATNDGKTFWRKERHTTDTAKIQHKPSNRTIEPSHICI